MSENKVTTLKKPGETSGDPLTELLRTGARQLITQTIEAELHEFLQQFAAFADTSWPAPGASQWVYPRRQV